MAGEPIQLEEKTDEAPKWMIDAKTSAIADCPIFYTGKKKYLKDAKARFPWECGDGWNDVIAKLSYKIETLNLNYYSKYRVRCQVEQIKEKFGTLRVYTRIVVDPPAWKMLLPNFLYGISNKISALKLDYKMKKIVNCKHHHRYEYEQLTKQDFESESSKKYKCTNEFYFKDSDRYYRVVDFDICETFHYEPTCHTVIFRIKNAIHRLADRIYAWVMPELTPVQRVISESFDNIVCQYVTDAEKECYDTCEICGAKIGSESNPRCETQGWINYICEKCAKNRNLTYVKHEIKEKKNENQI